MICKKCGGVRIVKNGFDKNGEQRFKCQECRSESILISRDDILEDDDIIASNIRLAKQKQKLQDINRIERKSFRESARIENALEEYIKELKRVFEKNKIPSVRPHKFKKPKSMIVQISDTHFNELVEMVGNRYDFEMASKRLFKLSEKIQLYLKTHDVKNIFIVMTGDLLNSDRRLDELLSMATNRAKATFLAVSILRQFISDLNQYANVNVISVTGNESRIRDEIGYVDALATDNFDFMIYEILSLLFEDSKSVNFLNGDGYEYIFSINDITFLVNHGQNLGKMRVNDISKVITKWSRKGIDIDYILCGHLHECKITDSISRCGSLVGNNSYSDVGLNLYGRASQNLLIVHEDNTVDIIRVDLQNVREEDKMYKINNDLERYNAKSLSKVQDRSRIEVMKIVI